MSASVLIVEDHRDVAQIIAQTLEQEQYIVDFASNGDAALQQVQQNQYDLILLDLTLPGASGLQICRTIRQQLFLETPVLMLTAKDTLEDKIKGFEHGADDYLVKPFEMAELLMRVRALLKRKFGKVVQAKRQLGDLVFDTKAMRVTREGQEIKLSPIGFSILEILLRESPNLVSRSQIEHELWGDDLPDSDALRSHLYTLRKALDKPFHQEMIQTIKGRGVRIIT